MIPRAAHAVLLATALGVLAAGCYADTTAAHSPGAISFQYRTHDYPAAFARGYGDGPAWSGAPGAVGGGPRSGGDRHAR